MTEKPTPELNIDNLAGGCLFRAIFDVLDELVYAFVFRDLFSSTISTWPVSRD